MNVVGVRFSQAGKIYYYKSNNTTFTYKDKVILDTPDGLDIGEVALTNIDIEVDKLDQDLGIVLRKASDEDLDIDYLNKADAKEAIEIGQEKANNYGLNMKIVDASYSFDKSKLTLYFTSDKRVDFRDLVKDLAATFKSRIELRQIGVRDHAKLVKHHGSCGQECCCSRHLTDFMPLSIKYAKDQNISLDPNKISGVCGRLMCCLSYEEENYIQAKKSLPKYGQKVMTEDGDGVVVNHDYVRCECKVKMIDRETEETIHKSFKPEDIEIIKWFDNYYQNAY